MRRSRSNMYKCNIEWHHFGVAIVKRERITAVRWHTFDMKGSFCSLGTTQTKSIVCPIVRYFKQNLSYRDHIYENLVQVTSRMITLTELSSSRKEHENKTLCDQCKDAYWFFFYIFLIFIVFKHSFYSFVSTKSRLSWGNIW